MKRLNLGLEDNIYIDCMPVELVNEERKTFMKPMPTLKGPNGLPVLPMPNVQGLSYATDLIDQISLDKYSFVRDAFLARRAEATGAPPALDTFIDEPDDAPPPAAAPSAPSK
jgi:hypothetical protein